LKIGFLAVAPVLNGEIIGLLSLKLGLVLDRAVLFAIYIDDLDALCKPESNLYVILHADDILLLASTMTILDIKKLLRDCECELKKSSCLRIGQRHDAECANISSSSG